MPLLVEMGWGGLVQAPWSITWTDITPYVDVTSGVTITRGASDELSETQPGTASMTLDNSDGRFTPGNPSSTYAPFVRRNAPIRVSQAVMPVRTGSAPYSVSMLGDDFDGTVDTARWTNRFGGAGLVNGRLRIPLAAGGSAGFQSAREWKLPNSSVCVRMSTAPRANGSSVAESYFTLNGTTNGDRIGFRFDVAAGLLRCVAMLAFVDGASVDVPFSPIDHLWLRIRESAGTVYWESSGDGWDWTILRSFATPSWASSQSLVMSMTNSRTGGTGDYIEWDLLGAQVRPRFWGMVNEFPVQWEGLYSSVTISATDLFKRLNRLPPLMSCLSEEIKALNPLAYYPLTEPAGSTSAGDLSGTTAGPLSVTQVGAGGTLDFGAGAGPASAPEALVVLTPASATAGKYLTADMGQRYQDSTVGNWNMMEGWFSTSTAGRVLFALTGSAGTKRIVWSLNGSGALQVETMVDGSTWQTATVSSGNLADGKVHHFAYDEFAGTVYVDGVSKAIGSVQWMESLRNLTIGGYAGARLWSGTIGHIMLTATQFTGIGAQMATHYQAGTTAFAGETAADRITRLAGYAGVGSVTVLGSTHDPVAGQGEGGSGVMARMREVETTESGRLYAERDYYGLAYQSRDLRYNPGPGSEVFEIDYADLDTLGVQLADDDQKLCNQVEASRPGGATQKVRADSSVLAFGLYGRQLEILKMTDNSVVDAASWIVSRYADPAPELREVPVEAFTMPSYLDILDAEISSYFTVYNLPAQASASELRVTVEGYTETIKHNSHQIQFRTSASATDSVWILEDPVYSQLDYTTRLAY